MKRLFALRRHQTSLTNHAILILFTLFAVLPLLVLVFNSVKSRPELANNPIGLPKVIHIENFLTAWVQGNFIVTVRNSAILVTGTVFLVLLLGGLAAYSLARLKPVGADAFMLFMIVGSTLPIWLFMVPLFMMWRSLGLMNNLLGLILIYAALNSPISIFILRSYMIQLPPDFEDAARVDGANNLQIFTNVILPLVWPGFLTVGLLVGMGVWGEFQIALIFVTNPDLLPVTTSYWQFTTRYSRDWALTSAAALMMIAPVLMMFLALQRRFIEGLTQGGLRM
jgi:raffinose/stachyose/melibiose transport system permease protein